MLKYLFISIYLFSGLLLFAQNSTHIPSQTEVPLVYTVQKGETALSICRKFRVSIKDLIELNKLNPSSIQVNIGQKIKIPRPVESIAEEPDKKQIQISASAKQNKSKPAPNQQDSNSEKLLDLIPEPFSDIHREERDSLITMVGSGNIKSEQKLKLLNRLISLIDLRISDLKRYNDTIFSRRSRVIDENDLDAMLLKMKESRMLAAKENENAKMIDSLQQSLQEIRTKKDLTQKQFADEQKAFREKSALDSLAGLIKSTDISETVSGKPNHTSPDNSKKSEVNSKENSKKQSASKPVKQSKEESEVRKSMKDDDQSRKETGNSDSLQTYVIKEVEIKKRKREPYYMIKPDTLRQIKSEFTLNRAAQMYNTRQINAAEKLIRKAIELNPNNHQAWMFHGDLSARFGYAEKAVKDYRIALEIAPNESQVHYNLAVTYQALYKLKEAYRSYTECIRIDPDYLLAYIGRAGILMEQKEFTAAIDDYNLVLNKSPYMTLALKGRGIARLANKEFGAAIADFNRFLELEKPEASVFHQRGLAKILNGDLLNGCMDLSSAVHMGRKEAQSDIQKFCN